MFNGETLKVISSNLERRRCLPSPSFNIILKEEILFFADFIIFLPGKPKRLSKKKLNKQNES
jgi:hypothetical protein